jgi:acyl carrier protein phosphodiesterase
LNYLVHLYLSDPAPLCRLGNLAGDFVKGPLDARWHPELARGLQQHRQVDSFAQNSTDFRRSKRRIAAEFGHYRGILVDVYYDHLLARNWDRFADRPLEVFARQVYRSIEDHRHLLPADFRRVAPRMIEHDWLVSYRDPAAVGRALERLGQRLTRPAPLADGLGELLRNDAGLEADCETFIQAASRHLQSFPRL